MVQMAGVVMVDPGRHQPAQTLNCTLRVYLSSFASTYVVGADGLGSKVWTMMGEPLFVYLALRNKGDLLTLPSFG